MAATVAFTSAAIILAVGSWQILRAREQTLLHAGREVSVLSQALAQHAARTIEAVDLTLQDASVRAVQGDLSTGALQAFLRQRVDRLGQLRNVAVVRPDGIWRTDALASKSLSSVERSYFAWHRAHTDNGLHLDGPIWSLSTGEPSIPLSRRLNNPDGSFAGLVVASLDPTYLDDIYQKVRTGERGTVSIWLSDGRLLARYPAAPAATPEAAAAVAAIITKLFAQGDSLSRGVSPIDGVERLFAFQHLDNLPVAVSASVSIDDALSSWRQDAWTEVAVIGTSAILLILLGVGLEVHRRRVVLLIARSQAADARYRMLADSTSDMVTHMALDGRRLYVSPASRKLLGEDPEALVGTNPIASVHPDDAEGLEAVLGALRSGERDQAFNINRLRHKDGHWVWVEASLQLRRDDQGRPESLVAAVRDVTDRHEVAEALQEREATYRVLAETTSDVITQLDLDLRWTFVSPACLQLLGCRAEDLVGHQSSTFVHPEDVGKRELGAKRLADGKCDHDRTVMTYRMWHTSGTWVWVEGALSLVRQVETGAPKSFICSLRDVTERQRIERHLRDARQAAEEASRVKADFVANTSHELRTPLTGILGVLDLLHRDTRLTMDQRRLLQLACGAGKSLLAIVNDVLDFSKIEAGQLSIERVPFGLVDLVESCREFVAESLKSKPVALFVEATKDVPSRCLGDPTRLRQVLLNLLLNAVKFTEQGRITLSLAYDRSTSLLTVEVADTGVGIPSGSADALFERFSQADSSTTRRFGGTGLGLAICKRIVDLMGGQISAVALEQGGSKFFFTVPMQAVEDSDAMPGSAEQVQIGVSKTRLLLAEDNVLNAEVIAAMLSGRGYAVTIVEDGGAAVDALNDLPSPFDLVLMDLQMPGMDGLTATSRIRAREVAHAWPHVPIIGLTANALVEDAALCRSAGMDDHVAKPVVWTTLFAAIDRALGDTAVTEHAA